MSGVQRVKKIPVTRKQTVWIPIKILSPDYYDFLMIFFFRKGRVSGKNLVCWNKKVEVTFHLLYNSVQFSCYKKKKNGGEEEEGILLFLLKRSKSKSFGFRITLIARSRAIKSWNRKEKKKKEEEEKKKSIYVEKKAEFFDSS